MGLILKLGLSLDSRLNSNRTQITAPSDVLVTTITSSNHHIAWTDNSNNEDGFEIWVSINNAAYTFVNYVLANVQTYDDTVTTGTVLSYEVRAYKNNDYSDFSTPVLASGSTYCAQALALFARMPAGITTPWKDLYNAKILESVNSGLWAKFDACWLLGGYDYIGAKLNIVEDDHNCVYITSEPAFVQKKGFTGQAGVALRTDYLPATDSVNFTRNSACFFFMMLNTGDVSNQRAQMGGGSYDILAQVMHPSGCFMEVNQNDFTGWANTGGTGIYIANRKGASVKDDWKNGVRKLQATNASVALTNVEQYLLGWHSGSSLWAIGEQMFIAGYAGALTDAECQTLNTWIQDFYNKIQAL